MNKLKKFYKDHEVEIIVGALAVTAIAVTVLVTKKLTKLPVDGRPSIRWTPDGKIFDLETVKRILDANVESNAMFAIFREGVNPTDYTIIALNGAQLRGF